MLRPPSSLSGSLRLRWLSAPRLRTNVRVAAESKAAGFPVQAHAPSNQRSESLAPMAVWLAVFYSQTSRRQWSCLPRRACRVEERGRLGTCWKHSTAVPDKEAGATGKRRRRGEGRELTRPYTASAALRLLLVSIPTLRARAPCALLQVSSRRPRATAAGLDRIFVAVCVLRLPSVSFPGGLIASCMSRRRLRPSTNFLTQ